jgi:hypothetical protein
MPRAKSNERRYTSARDRAEKHTSGFSSTYLKLPNGVQSFKPKPGVMLLDIIPFVAGKGNPWAEPGNLHWERTIFVHRGIGANGDTFLCPRKISNSPCPICEHRARLMKDADEDKEELIKDLAPKERQLINLINLKEPDKGVQVWDVSYHLFGKVLEARIRNSDEDEGWENFFFLEGGMTLKIGFAEKSFGGVSFAETETIDFKPRKTEYDEDILEKVLAFDDLLIEPKYDALKAAFLQKDDDEDEDEAPKKSSAKPKSKKSVDDEEDEDEDEEIATRAKSKKKQDEEAEDEDFDDDEKPAKSKKKPVDDEEDDDDEVPAKSKKKKPVDDDEDDWDEDEAPKPKSKKPAVDDDEDDDDAPVKSKKKPVDDDEDEDEDEAPAKSKSKKKPVDDDEDWDDFDDDEDEKPAKSKSKKKPVDDDEDDE